MSTREEVGAAIHRTLCETVECTPGSVDWLAVADAALAEVDRQRAS